MTVSPTGKGPTAGLASAGSSYRWQRRGRQQRAGPRSPPGPWPPPSQPPGPWPLPEEGLLGPPPLTVCLLAGTPELSAADREGAGEQAEGAGGVPPFPIYHQVAVCLWTCTTPPAACRRRGSVNGVCGPAETGFRRAAGPSAGACARGPRRELSARAWRRPCSLRPFAMPVTVLKQFMI